VKKVITIVSLFIYLLFGFLNSSAIGFCFGSEENSHFGMIIAGYETCCNKDETAIHNHQNNTSFSCNCKDINIKSVILSQVPFSISESIKAQDSLFITNIQPFFYNISYLSLAKNKSVFYKETPPDLLSKNSEIIKSSIILLI
jgi:hypothetical protein